MFCPWVGQNIIMLPECSHHLLQEISVYSTNLNFSQDLLPTEGSKSTQVPWSMSARTACGPVELEISHPLVHSSNNFYKKCQASVANATSEGQRLLKWIHHTSQDNIKKGFKICPHLRHLSPFCFSPSLVAHLFLRTSKNHGTTMFASTGNFWYFTV